MKKVFLVIGYLSLFHCLNAQSVKEKLLQTYQQFESDSQLRHAISSLYVINAKTGEVVFDKNSKIGLAPASTQKIITAATAFELLGKDYRYKTILNGNENQIFVSSFYDPTFGSWRYANTKDTVIFKKIIDGLKQAGINKINELTIYDNDLEKVPPGGWLIEDVANYYGATAQVFNWHENQYDVTFIPGKKVGDQADLDTSITPNWWNIINSSKTGAVGSGDNAYIYFVPGNSFTLIKGTVPGGANRFSISGADPSPYKTFNLAFQNYASKNKFFTGEKDNSTIAPWKVADAQIKNPLFTYYSPSLDSIIYWFLQKSINLYGEALLKTFAYEKRGFGATDTGVVIVKDFWKKKGLDENELNIYDGSGLSPLNRVTTHAQVDILKYAKERPWYPYFFNALPEYNNMKMKSGSISDVKGFCGYHTSGDGTQYMFSFLINNYSGSSSALVNKMYKVLDVLK